MANLLFTFAALGAASISIFELLSLKTTDITAYALGVRYTHIPIFILLVSLVWFLYIYFGTAKQWLAFLITGLWTIALIVNFISPSSLTFLNITELKQIPLFWGENFSIPVGSINPWKFIADFASLLILIYIVDASIRLWKKGEKRRAGVVGGSMVFFMMAAGIHTPFVDEGIIKTPYMISFTFLAVLIAIAHELNRDVFRASELSKEVVSNEQRWRSLLENVQFLVVGVDKDGIIYYVNPFYLKTTSYTKEEIIGKHYNFVVLPKEKDNIENLTGVLQKENKLPNTQVTILTKNGEERIIYWSNVLLKDSEGKHNGTIAVGNDLTEKIIADEDLKKAYIEVEELKNRLEDEVVYLQQEIISERFEEILGESPAINYVLNRIEEVAGSSTTVLLEGETGVGKELFARAIHNKSLRKNKPIITINCASIPLNLLESELFGYEKGAFTGAEKQKHGRFELADNGTLFLDEIGDLPMEIQPKLLRVLESGEFERLGSEKTIKVNVRLIAATNKILKDEVYAGNFREDLFYRIHIFPISVPPLRQRKTDIPLLVNAFVNNLARKHGKRIDQIPQRVMTSLQNYEWPGNVRELMNVIERAVITSKGNKLLLVDEFKSSVRLKEEVEGKIKSLDENEHDHILKVLEACNWKISGEDGAASILNLHPNTLRSRMEKLNIKKSFV
ncbi:MAG: hypothetical protein BMS9Abin39_0383 [Ignavibacteria bacterium]|nr:MAG: hypothetical protein BMS9Abin39_0383 [Ignavibacteria bacterium]